MKSRILMVAVLVAMGASILATALVVAHHVGWNRGFDACQVAHR